MNREQKRSLEKRLRKKGIKKERAQELVKKMNDADLIRQNGSGVPNPPRTFAEGDKVKMNLELIKSRVNYEKMSDDYKRFVEEHADEVFTAHVERTNLISFMEEPRWLFGSGDLVKVELDDCQDADDGEEQA